MAEPAEAASAPEAVVKAQRVTHWRKGYCLNFVRTMLGGPGGVYDANASWARSSRKHPGDRTPPAGVPVYFAVGKHGHVALSLGGGRIRSTDWPSANRVGTVTISQLSGTWGARYLGWTGDINGGAIDGIRNTVPTRRAVNAHDIHMMRLWRAQRQGKHLSAHQSHKLHLWLQQRR